MKMQIGLKVWLLIFAGYMIVQIFRLFVRVNWCPRCLSVVGAWTIGSIWLPNIALVTLIGASAMEFSDIIRKMVKKKKPKVAIQYQMIALGMMAIILGVTMYFLNILTLQMIIAAMTGAMILKLGMVYHTGFKQMDPSLSKKIPTAFLVALFGLSLVIQLAAVFGWV
jgi:hypothetical protein